jgi:uncharacterized protein (TIGR04255 family)
MGRSYKDPPILEALCEFQFEPSQPWDLTIPGLVYSEVKSEFPKRRPFNPFRFEFQVEGQGQIVQNVGSGTDRMQFMREDERSLIQVGPDLLAVNHLKPYSNWETFKQMIERSLGVYRQVADPQAVKRIGLRYINRLEFPNQPSVEIERYLLAVPTVPSDVPQVFTSWAQRIEIPFTEANGLLVLQSRSVSGEVQKDIAFLLDLDFVTLQAQLVTLDSAMEWVERAHDEIEGTFEASVTPEAKRLFGEEEQDDTGNDNRAQRR